MDLGESKEKAAARNYCGSACRVHARLKLREEVWPLEGPVAGLPSAAESGVNLVIGTPISGNRRCPGNLCPAPLNSGPSTNKPAIRR